MVLRETRTVDSVYINDSIVIREGGDTIVRERWRTCWRERIVHDTVVEHLTDTVRITDTVEVEKTVEVPKKGGNAGWAVALALLAVIIIYLFFKTH